MATQTYPDHGELDVEAYEPADAHDVYGRIGGFFDPGAPSRDELYFDPETMQYADEPDAIRWDMVINGAGDSGRVENFRPRIPAAGCTNCGAPRDTWMPLCFKCRFDEMDRTLAAGGLSAYERAHA